MTAEKLIEWYHSGFIACGLLTGIFTVTAAAVFFRFRIGAIAARYLARASRSSGKATKQQDPAASGIPDIGAETELLDVNSVRRA